MEVFEEGELRTLTNEISGDPFQRYPFVAESSPRRDAIFMSSRNELACIFSIMLPRCTFTVISEMPSSAPTCLFKRPDTTSPMTSRSR